MMIEITVKDIERLEFSAPYDWNNETDDLQFEAFGQTLSQWPGNIVVDGVKFRCEEVDVRNEESMVVAWYVPDDPHGRQE